MHQSSEKWSALSANFEPFFGTRQIIVLHVESLQTSCGFGIPFYEYREDRPTLIDWAKDKGGEGVNRYWKENNQTSIDGLPTGIFD